MTVAKLGEFDLICAILKRWPLIPADDAHVGLMAPNRRRGPGVLVSAGDDAAAILPQPGRALLFTTDTLLEGTHFDRSFSTFLQVGYKAIHVNVSDIAAMGGQPLYFLVSLGISEKEKQAHIHQLYKGMRQASQAMNLSLIGGNIVRSDRFFVSITLIGEARPKQIITRAGGAPGDLLYVTGTLGDAAAGIAMLKRKGMGRPLDIRFLTARHRTPTARWREGLLLAQEEIPSAMIDISDGLASDLYHLAHQSETGAEIDQEKIPISPALARSAKAMNADPIEYALYGGDDYELLFAVSAKKKKRLDALIARGVMDARCIGRLVEKRNGLLIKDQKLTRPLERRGYDHLKGNSTDAQNI